MTTYILFFLGAIILIFLLTVIIQLIKVEGKLKDLYFYTERKIKMFFEFEEDIE